MPDFNALVLQMRAARTTESMMVLYRHVFELEQWFLPADPEDPPARCSGASRRASTPRRVSSLAVRDAVRWMVSGNHGVNWVSFNHGEGSENFPIYFFQLEELANAFLRR